MQKNNIKNIVYAVLGVAVVGGLFAWPIINDKTRPMVKEWNKAGIGCLPSHQNAAQHIHPFLYINVDGASERIPANLGVVRSCMAEMHTHDEPNKIHLESIDPSKKFKLSDFLLVYGKPLERDGYKLEALLAGSNSVADPVKGTIVADPANLILEESQQIILNYTKIAEAAK